MRISESTAVKLICAVLILCFASLVGFGERLLIRVFTTANGLGGSFVDGVFRDSHRFLRFSMRDGLSRFNGSRYKNVTKRNFLLSLLAFLLVLSCAEPVRAERPPFKIYTTEEGLAHDSVNKIVRDSRGFLWFCTAEGLSRFDGARFTNYAQDQGLPHRSINDFLETRDGDYLIATNAGLSVFNPHGKAYRWNVLESKLEQTSDEPPLFRTFVPANTNDRFKKTILSLAQDTAGRIWAGTVHGLFRVEKIGAEWRFQPFEAEGWNSEGDAPVLYADSKGNLLLGTGFRIFPDGKWGKFEKFGAESIMEDRDGKIWVGASGNPVGLRVFEYENDSLKLSKTYTTKDGLADDGFHYALKQTSDGRIFVALAKGLCEFLPDARENEPKFRVLNNDRLTSLAEDSGGSLWLGTEIKGAWKLARNGFSSFGEKDGITNLGDLNAIYINRDGEIFLPTRPNSIFHLVGEKFENILPFGLKARNWGWNFLDFEAQDGEWWIAAYDGLRRYPNVARFADLARTPPKKIYTKADGLTSNAIFVLFEDSRGDIWITADGDSSGDTLSRWERATDKIISYTAAADGMPKSNGAISFAEDLQGNVWFGFYFGSLARYRNGKFQLFTAKDGISESQIDDLLVDSSGRLWIATTGRGLLRLDDTNAENPVFTNISTQNGLSSNLIICLTEDRFKRIYAGTGRGINRIDPNGTTKIFTQADGLPSNYITRCAADKNGALWFVTQNTLVRFIPEIEQNLPPPPVFIDKISVNGVPQKISALGETEIKPIELASDQRQIQIDFFALTFGAGENIRYQYRLDEQDWSSPTEEQTLNLNLSSGKHDFAVRAVRADNTASEKPAIVSLRILSPIWARWWFILLSAVSVAIIAILLYRYRTARLREVNAALGEAKFAEEALSKSREERLIELEKVRTRIATDLHDDIGASLTQIAVLSEVAQRKSNGSGQANEPLHLITNVSNELVEAMSDIVWAINPRKDHLADLLQRMRRFASDVLSARNIKFDFHAPHSETDISLGANIRREVFLIFKESINNIVKHSGATRAEMEFQLTKDWLVLKISDNGAGFSPEAVAANAGLDLARGKGGTGLNSMKKRAGEVGGEYRIISLIGGGTTIILRVPLGKNVQGSKF